MQLNQGEKVRTCMSICAPLQLSACTPAVVIVIGFCLKVVVADFWPMTYTYLGMGGLTAFEVGCLDT